MLPEKLIYQSTFLVHLIQKKKKQKKQYRPVLIAPQVTKELYATLTLTLDVACFLSLTSSGFVKIC